MAQLKVVSWNVNSIRTRIEHITTWLNSNEWDVMCLQETKVKDDDFPFEPFEASGWHVYIHGQPAYNGVAFISKKPMDNIETGFLTGDLNDQKRVIRGEVDGIKIINVYVPQGESLDSPKFVFKEEFYAHMLTLLKDVYQPDDKVVLCGDFNVAPEERDVWSPERWRGDVMFTEEEHAWLGALMDWGMHDSFRMFHEEDELFSWWDYRRGRFQRNEGGRIDHLLISNGLKELCIDGGIDKEPRGLERPSDHVPVWVTVKTG